MRSSAHAACEAAMTPMQQRCASAARQRGVATLVVTCGLFLAMALATLAVNRNLVFAQRAAANQARATQAFEAAEAGAEWALAQLNNTQASGADCLPSDAPSALTFRDRTLHVDPASARFTPVATAQPICARGPEGWACACASGGTAAVTEVAAAVTLAGSAPAPAFTMRVLADGHAGVVRIVSTGCTSLAGACLPGSTSAPDATAQVSVALALHGALRRPPRTALSAYHSDPLVPGTDQFFASFFGVDKSTWTRQPVAAVVACPADCSVALSEVVAAGRSLIQVDGDVTLSTPIALGSTLHPVAIVATGKVRIESGVTVVGAVYARAFEFEGGAVQGAAISETAFDGAPRVSFDADVLAALARANGSLVRINGSWRDF
jgi:Tfp pilus assembly protein PilX